MNNDRSYWVSSGGGWNDDARFARVALRNENFPSLRCDALGFRLSRLVNPLKQMSEVLDEKR